MILNNGDPAVVQWLDAMGISIPWQRVIIDIQIENPVRIHVEALGTAQMLEVKPPDLRGAEITVLADKRTRGTCALCAGEGVTHKRSRGGGATIVSAKCRDCDGTGMTLNEPALPT